MDKQFNKYTDKKRNESIIIKKKTFLKFYDDFKFKHFKLLFKKQILFI